MLLMMLACSTPSPPGSSPDQEVATPCGPAGAVHASAEGSPVGDGAVDWPVSTFARALELAVARDVGDIVVHGQLDEEVVLDGGAFVVTGCEEAALGSLAVEGGEHTLAGFELRGRVRARSGARLRLEGITIRSGEGAGLVVRGLATVVEASAVRIEAPSPIDVDGRPLALGVVVDAGHLELDGLVVRDAQGVGVLVSGAGSLSGRGLDVDAVHEVDGLGRALQLQDWSSATLVEPRLVAPEAALMALRASSASLEGGELKGRDGLVAGQPETAFDPAEFQVSVRSVVLEVERGQVVAQAVTVDAEGLEILALPETLVVGGEPQWLESLEVNWTGVDPWSF